MSLRRCGWGYEHAEFRGRDGLPLPAAGSAVVALLSGRVQLRLHRPVLHRECSSERAFTPKLLFDLSDLELRPMFASKPCTRC